MSENTEPRRWLLVIDDPGVGWLSANDRLHHHERAARTRAWREAAGWRAKALRVPRLQRAHLLVTIHPSDRRRRDAANLHPTVKAVVDGLIDAHLLPDDSDAYLLGPDLRTGAPVDPGRRVRLSVTITELPTTGG